MSNDAVSNVIPLRVPDSPDLSQHAQQFEHLLDECRDLTRERLSQSLAGMLHKAEDTLWELSKATQDRDTQKLYMEVKEKLLPQRDVMEERFRIRYLTEFDSRAGQARKAKPSFSDYTDTSLELGLVGEDDLNESLKVKEMAGKLRAYCEEELAALDQRVGVLLGDANLQADNNPFSPQAICDAFKHACRDIEPDIRIRMVLVKLFDDHVLDDIRSIYKAVNALLVQHSILPKIRYGPSRNREGGRAPAAAELLARVRAGAASAGVENPSRGGEQDVFSVLQSSDRRQRKGDGAGGCGRRAPGGGSWQRGGRSPDYLASLRSLRCLARETGRRRCCSRAQRCLARSRGSSTAISARRAGRCRCRPPRPKLVRPTSYASSKKRALALAWARWTWLPSISWRCCSIRFSRTPRSPMG